MLAVDRQNTIKQMLKEQDSISIVNLSQFFDVSSETIRRDLDKICHDDSRVIKIYGGAYIAKANQDTPYGIRESAKINEKRRIAEYCLSSCIRGNDCIMLDGSTTTLQIARLLADSDITATVITNGMAALEVLSRNPKLNIICTGGNYSHPAHTFFGNSAISTLNNHRANVAFLSSSGLDISGNLTDSNEETALIHLNMLKNSIKHILVVDSNKFGRNRPYRVAGLDSFSAVITDNHPGKDWDEMFKSLNIAFVVA